MTLNVVAGKPTRITNEIAPTSMLRRLAADEIRHDTHHSHGNREAVNNFGYFFFSLFKAPVIRLLEVQQRSLHDKETKAQTAQK